MSRHTNLEKRQRFSLRKTTLGLVSATIASLLLGIVVPQTVGTSVVADTVTQTDTVDLSYHYVLESELTDDEKELIIKETPKYTEHTTGTYLLVYRPKNVATIKNTLPQTGDLSPYIASLTGLSLLVFVVAVGKKGKKTILPVLLVAGLGSFALSTSAFAWTEGALAHYNSQHRVGISAEMPAPETIPGYDYVGYITFNKSSQSTSIEANRTYVETSEESSSTTDTNLENQPKLEQQEELVTETQALPFETIYEDNPNLAKGEEREKQAGVLGSLTTTYRLVSIDGQVVERHVESVNRVEPINQVIERGSQAPVVTKDNAPVILDALPDATMTEETEVVREPIAFETVYEDNPNLPVGTEQVKTPGVVGEKVTTYTVVKVDGQVVERKPISQTTTDPVTQVIERGSQVSVVSPETPPTRTDDFPNPTITEETEVVRESIAFETVYEDNPNLPVGTEQVKTAGVLGERVTTYTVVKSDGKVLERKPVSETITEPIAQVIERGRQVSVVSPETPPTKTDDLPNPTITEETEVVREPIAFETVYEDNPNLPVGTEQVKTAGVLGERVTTYTVIKSDGKILERKSVSEAITEPIAQVIERGVKALEKPTVTITTIHTHPETNTIDVTYQKLDPSNSLLSANAQIFKGDQLVKEVPVTDYNGVLAISGLDLYTDYLLKTEITYKSPTGQEIALDSVTKDFRLEMKKIEFKDVDSVELYEKTDSGLKRRLSLDNLPTDPSLFMVKIKSDKSKEAWLPVQSFETSVQNNQPTYEVKVAFDELVQERSAAYQSGFVFHVARSVKESGVYHSFKELVEAMRQTPTGKFILGADMTADELTLADADMAYVSGNFSGQLIGENKGKKFAIYNLAKPLFDTLLSATVTNLDLKDVAISTGQTLVGSLAKMASHSTVSNVAAQGQIQALNNIGGLVARSNNDSKLNNVSFEGTLRSTYTGDANTFVGGLVGEMLSNAKLTSGHADIAIYSNNRSGGQRSGGLVGLATNGAHISNSYATGTISNTVKAGQNGGIVGSTWTGGVVDNVISAIDVINGNPIYGDGDYKEAKVTNAFVTQANTDRYATLATKEEVKAKKANYGLTATTSDSSDLVRNQLYSVDYTKLNNATTQRQTAYENIEKLMPFYNKELIVYYGNKVAESDKLYTTPILDVVPMADNDIITDVYDNQKRINRLMVHYADNKVEYLPLAFKEAFKNNQLLEYTIGDTGLIYVPEQFVANYDNIINQVLPELMAIDFESEAVRQAVGVLKDDNGNYGRSMKYLFLKDVFDETKADLKARLRKVLASDKSVNTMGKAVEEALVEKIKANKVEFLLGLSYLNRWYDINFGPINSKELTAYKFDFFGDNTVSTLDVLINIGKSKYDNLAASSNEVAYRNVLAPYKKQKDVFTYLDAYRQLFLPTKTNNQWLKENTKAYVVESKSTIPEVREKQEEADSQKDNKYSVGVYDKITASNWRFRNMLLPLMTMKNEVVYIISNMATISFGGYERYVGDNGRFDLSTYMRKQVDQAATWQRDHQDFWYKMLQPEYRDKLYRSVLNYDGFKYRNPNFSSSWRERTASDKSITEFFGSIGKWLHDNNTGAYADGTETNFIHDRILDQYGTSVYTHEMVHNSDGGIYFEGNGRREGQGAELYALGLLQNPYNPNDESFGINTMFKGDFDNENRFHTGNPIERFADVTDLNNYMKGTLDVVYTLELLEADAVLKLDNTQKKAWFRKLVNFHEGNHAGNAVKPLSDEEVSKLTSLDALVENDIVTRRGYGHEWTWKRNGYNTINMFAGNYAGLDNPSGAPGDVMFRRMAYELLAEKGYRDGFIPYVSNYYRNRNLPMTDTTVLKEMFNGHYKTWDDFKKAMYQSRRDKVTQLKPITIRYELGNENTKQMVTITNYEQMQKLMSEAVAHDIKHDASYTQADNPRSWVHKLKRKIFNAYIRQTNDFRDSIYNSNN